MTRGRPFELVLAIVGVAGWLGLALLGVGAHSVSQAVIAFALAGLSVFEMILWQQGRPTLAITNRQRARRGDPALPQTAWFGLGGLSAEVLVGVGWGLVRGFHGDQPTTDSNLWLPGAAVYLVCGGLTAWLLSRNSDRREGATRIEPKGRPGIPPPPPPPVGSVAAHESAPVHDLGGPTSTLYHLQREHGVEMDPFSSAGALEEEHASLHGSFPQSTGPASPTDA